jgi:hypothetical protein
LVRRPIHTFAEATKLLWAYSGNLYQQSQITEHATRSGAIEQRVAQLQAELHKTQSILHQVIALLEKQAAKDLDGDGRIG